MNESSIFAAIKLIFNLLLNLIKIMSHVNSLMTNINLDCVGHRVKRCTDGYLFHFCKIRHTHNCDCSRCSILKLDHASSYQLTINFDDL